jgi:hypothetical protein
LHNPRFLKDNEGKWLNDEDLMLQFVKHKFWCAKLICERVIEMVDSNWKKGMMFENENKEILRHDALRESWESRPPIDE